MGSAHVWFQVLKAGLEAHLGSCWSSSIPFYWVEKVALMGKWGGGWDTTAPSGGDGEAEVTSGILLVIKLRGPGRPEDLLSWVGGKALVG